ncbi:lipid IV(A) 3-deoxy-D-manno-octulosonic acid transferase [Vibrio parahaemolyticus]|uniref:lipid IV(A) 3-deoxy-D-manno-octulosonic acid transferase n=1 Tax=Vibrio parahaemolyticus TaxID=670 RepID=UPI00041123B6|nr:lipid IV(A) 3-deoxy-D-manno-octulosonic acid transferase [Vibrio parahaemolyticus]EGR3003195.1 3-deoxy-D-manno-octulosonic acid transferase [Vibrio parahaemolyticus]EJH0828408.1 lipid IV(A) 3-deoxy-D-manno-octulosonic acid transferase [Vibrio parahaemolyticus]EJK2108785.1 lipid IV(A) 3-deoxy-D-manno-octulosonic acid transferase [Vibrio parahaemolyticus]EJK2184635.1 lipid IV(A) 3-deoxy-D-manno-octulosonic acid transferase [Vibrio parahaemolyticus]EJK2209401.1 lipid IV(A) 3-deoxy-D-manno-octu
MFIRITYTLLLTLVSPIFLFSLYKKKPNKPRFGPRWKEHFGVTPRLKSTNKPIWIHAVSVGECIAATPLIEALKKQTPEQTILVTTTTSTGAEQISKLGELVEHRYMPIDFSFAVKGFLKKIQPKQMLIIETELWPNTLSEVHKAGIPITVVNARLSAKSCNNYTRVQPLFNLMQPCITKVLCQTESDAARFEHLGLDREKLSITGSIKFDIQISGDIREKSKKLRQAFGKSRPVWIAASTHKGEDEQVLIAHQQVLKSHPNALLILVPRHPERFDSINELCQKWGFETVRRTTHTSVTESTQVYLGDTMGEMLLLLGVSDVCFMGGSLVGDKVGGHNMLEPAALGIPTITGPSYFNFKEVAENLIALGALRQIQDKRELAHALTQIIQNPDTSKEMARNAEVFVKKNQGAIAKTINFLLDISPRD